MDYLMASTLPMRKLCKKHTVSDGYLYLIQSNNLSTARKPTVLMQYCMRNKAVRIWQPSVD